MHRFFRALLILITLATVWSAGEASAATVCITDFISALDLEESIAQAARTAPRPEPKREVPPPQRPADALLAMAGTSAGTSMSGSPVTPVSGIGGLAVATLEDPSELSPAAAGSYLETSDWLFIPPRFLDGVFRPPRHVVSL